MCTILGVNIVISLLHTEFKNGEDIALGFQTTAAQNRAWVSDKAKNRTFGPPVKIRGGVGEIYESMIVAAPMTEPLVYI